MTTIMPEGDNIRKAVKWISGEREGASSVSVDKLLEEAGAKFNLSPREADYLHGFLSEKKG
jgi:hypothetical protein